MVSQNIADGSKYLNIFKCFCLNILHLNTNTVKLGYKYIQIFRFWKFLGTNKSHLAWCSENHQARSTAENVKASKKDSPVENKENW